ncbi:GRAM domain [Popillia japonica]|uniref:GRAM domain n=1 Tax=Popillia japonica TaxID=7064 RepID=A0AAW1L368_POPJA
MSLNTAHINGGVLIHNGECILIFSDKVSLDWQNTADPVFKGTKKGRIYLTTHRMIFNAAQGSEKMQSFSFPFVTLSNMQLEQPVFGANYIRGTVTAQPNGNWEGTNEFKLTFKNGGAIEFGQAMLKAANLATRSYQNRDGPPPYTPPNTQWYAAPPPAYGPAPTGYYGWMPPTNTFPDHPPQNTVFMTDAPPPYPGLPAGYQGQPAGAAGMTPHNPAAFAKAQEAAQSAYYDPNQPQMAYVPPPAYYENPPSYEQATHKKDQ